MPSKVTVKLISTAADCTLRKFIKCAFENDLTVLIIKGKPTETQLQNAWNNVHDEYFDLSGQERDIDELHILRRLKVLEYHLKVVAAAVFTQQQAVNHPLVGKPFTEYFDLFTTNGYSIEWNGNKDNFLVQLDAIEKGEATYKQDFEQVKKELENYRQQQESSGNTNNLSRKNFMRTINVVEKMGNKVDIETLSVERFALMIADIRELTNLRNSKN